MKRVHLVIGEDDFLAGEKARKLLEGFESVEVVDSAESSNAESQMRDVRAVDESVSIPPFLEPNKATWWKNAHFLPRGGRKSASAEVKEALERLADKIASNPLPGNQIFVVCAPGLLPSSLFAKKLKDAAETHVVEDGGRDKARFAAERAAAMAREEGLAFERGAAEMFVATVGCDTRSIKSEIDKMREYLGEGAATVSCADVAEISSRGAGVEPAIWSVTDAVAARDAKKALEELSRFEGDSGYAVLATTVIEKLFRQLALLKEASARGKPDEAASAAGMNPYAARKNSLFLNRWSLIELRRARALFLSLREKAVSMGESVRELVAPAVARTCRAPDARAGADAGRNGRAP